MIVVDASAALDALVPGVQARDLLRDHDLHAPHLIDSEVANSLRRRTLAGQLTAAQAFALLRAWSVTVLERYPVFPLLDRIWELRGNLSAYEAG